MATLDLVRFLADSADEVLKKPKTAAPSAANDMVDEAEEMIALAASTLGRRQVFEVETREAA
jgi:hypothetical protein